MTFLYILLFIVCLSTLIMVHEAGHLITAKIFKVYCFEYALGFGPRLLSFKRKNGETRFSIRAIPFGGFVSMYGEADAVPEEFEKVEIDPSRSINNIKHWKRAIIMTAGILMNFVLAMVVFFIYEIAFPAYGPRVGHITVAPNSLAYEAGLRSRDHVYAPILRYDNNTFVFYDEEATLKYADETTKQVYVGYDLGQMTIKDQDVATKAVVYESVPFGEITIPTESLTYEQYFNKEYTLETVDYQISGYFHWRGYKDKTIFFEIVENYLDTDGYGIPLENKYILISTTLNDEDFKSFFYIPDGVPISLAGNFVKSADLNDEIVLNAKEFETTYPDTASNLIKQTNLNPTKLDFDIDVVKIELEDSRLGEHHLSLSVDGGTLVSPSDKPIGLAMQLDSHRNSYGESVKNSFADFGRSTTLIFRGLGSLFTKDGWRNVGGIIAIGVATTQTLEQNGFGNFLFMWAMISVNLGIVNLLPFPGLDGWQFLVTIVEGVAHKEIPPKVKNTVSAVGIMLLFALMILIVIKDIIMVV